MASHRPPRRTRVYDANYNIGQSLYKSALDNLDRKRSGLSDLPKTVEAPLSSLPRSRYHFDEEIDDDLKAARARATRAITEESVFDRRAAAGSLRAFANSSAYENDIDEDVQASLSRIRANKSKMSSLVNDLDLEDSISSMRRRAKMDMANKILDAEENGDVGVGSSFRARALKISANIEAEDEPIMSSKVSKSFRQNVSSLASSAESSSMSTSASMRAKQTKARLADLESDMFQRSEKQLEREKRAHNLRKLLADNDIEPIKSLKHVTF